MERHYGRRACAQGALPSVVHAMAMVGARLGGKPRARRAGLSIRRKSRHLAWLAFKNDNGDKMSGFLPLRPGLWWMRRWHLPGKLITVGVLMAGALAMAAMDAPWWSVALAGAVVLYALCALYMGLASDLQSVAHAMEQTTRGDLSARAGVNGSLRFLWGQGSRRSWMRRLPLLADDSCPRLPAGRALLPRLPREVRGTAWSRFGVRPHPDAA